MNHAYTAVCLYGVGRPNPYSSGSVYRVVWKKMVPFTKVGSRSDCTKLLVLRYLYQSEYDPWQSEQIRGDCSNKAVLPKLIKFRVQLAL